MIPFGPMQKPNGWDWIGLGAKDGEIRAGL